MTRRQITATILRILFIFRFNGIKVTFCYVFTLCIKALVSIRIAYAK
jgi:hypothetical protein